MHGSFLVKVSIVVGFVYSTVAFAVPHINSQTEIKELRQLVLAQQKQLKEQAHALKVVTYRLNQLARHQQFSQSSRKRKVYPPKKYTKQPIVATHLPAGVVLTNKNVHLKLSGQFNQAMLYANDEHERNLFFTTNENSISRINVRATTHPNQDLTVGGQVELGFEMNSSDAVTQANPHPNSFIDMRKVEIFAISKQFGTVWLGKGQTASDDTAEQDLSGTDVVAYSGVPDLGGGLYFRTPGVKAYSNNPQVGDVFNDLDGYGRQMRLRYDTPIFHGWMLSTSAIEDNAADVALKYHHTLGKTKLAGAIAYTSPNDLNDTRGNILDGSFSILLPCGFNTTIAGGKLSSHHEHRDNPYYYYVKLGYQRLMWSIGKTAFSIDYERSKHYAQNNDIGKAYGAAVVQNILPWNLALYAGYRKLMLHRVAARFNQINTVVLGAIFKF